MIETHGLTRLKEPKYHLGKTVLDENKYSLFSVSRMETDCIGKDFFIAEGAIKTHNQGYIKHDYSYGYFGNVLFTVLGYTEIWTENNLILVCRVEAIL